MPRAWTKQVQLSERERKAVAESGQQGFIKEQAAMLEGVRGEWAALRSALRRAVGAARTLLLTDGACRLHAVPEDRLEQVWHGDVCGLLREGNGDILVAFLFFCCFSLLLLL